MTAEASRAVRDRWCDADGAPLSLFCWVQQVTEHPEREALSSRLHQYGQVLGRGPDVLYVRFHGQGQLVSLPPQLLRLLPEDPPTLVVTAPTTTPVRTGHPTGTRS
jgi:hypothetical protein